MLWARMRTERYHMSKHTWALSPYWMVPHAEVRNVKSLYVGSLYPDSGTVEMQTSTGNMSIHSRKGVCSACIAGTNAGIRACHSPKLYPANIFREFPLDELHGH